MVDKRYRTVLKGPLGDAKPAAVFLSETAAHLETALDLLSLDPQVDLTLEAIGEANATAPESGHWWVYLPDDAPVVTGTWAETVAHFADRLFVAHPIIRDRLVAAGVAKERVTLLYPGINSEVFTAEGPSQKLSEAPFHILFWGAIDWVSGVDVALKACLEAFKQDDAATLVIADPQSEGGLDRLEALKQEVGWPASRAIQYLQVDNWDSRDRARLFRSCDLLLCPQRLVGYAQQLREALACGMAALVPDRSTGLRAGSPTRFLVHEEHQQRGGQTLVWHEPDVGAVAFHLAALADRGKGVREQAMLHADEVARQHPWSQVAQELLRHLPELADPPVHDVLKDRLEHINSGMTAIDRSDFLAAEKAFQSALELDVADPDALMGMAFAAFQLKKWQACIDHLIPYVTMRPNDTKGLNLLAIALYRSGDNASAKCFFEAVLELEPAYEAAKRSLSVLKHVKAEVAPLYQPLWEHLKRRGKGTKPTISLCMIAKDEEMFLAQCLMSVQQAVDEIIVVDTGSSDRTVEIAQEFGAKVFHFPWTGDFAEARNQALAHATGDWVLILDADEVLEPESVELLRMVVEKPTEKLPIYLLRIINLVGREGKGEVEHYMLRLFPNVPEIRFVGRIHEQPQHQNEELVERAALPDIKIRHYGYKTETIEERGKEARNLELLQRAIDEDPDNCFDHFNQGMTLKMAGRRAESLTSLFRAVDLAFLQNHKPAFLATAHVYILSNFLDMNRPAEALAHGAKVRDICSEHADYWVSMGLAFFLLARYEEAIKTFEQAIQLGLRPSIHLVERASYSWRPRLGIANSQRALGNLDAARKGYTELLDLHPDTAHIRFLLAQLELEQQRFDLAEQHLRWILLHHSEGASWDAAWPQWLRLADRCNADDGLKIFRRLPISMDVLRPWALTALQQGQTEETVEVAAQWINLLPEPDAYQVRAEAYLNLGRLADAEADLRAALDLEPRAILWNNLGLVFLRRGEYDKGREAFQQALELEPEFAEAWTNLAQLAYLSGDVEGARQAVDSLLNRFPDRPEGQLLKATLESEMGHLDSAAVVLENVLASRPDMPQALLQLGYLRLEQERYAEALEPFGKALQGGLTSADLYRGLGMALLNVRNYEDAENAFRLALDRKPEDEMSRQGLQVAMGLREADQIQAKA